MTVHFPTSPVIDAPVDDAIVADIAEEALQAFFSVVVARFDDYYPCGKTTGDMDPLYSRNVDKTAREWVLHHAMNHPAIQDANED